MKRFILIVRRPFGRYKKGTRILLNEKDVARFERWARYYQLIPIESKADHAEEIAKLAAVTGISDKTAEEIVNAGYTYESFKEALAKGDEKALSFLNPLWRKKVLEYFGIPVEEEQPEEPTEENNEEETEE